MDVEGSSAVVVVGFGSVILYVLLDAQRKVCRLELIYEGF